MNLLYCRSGHFWSGIYSKSVCPHCHTLPAGLVDLHPYRTTIRSHLEPHLIRSLIKHGHWSGYGLVRMVRVLLAELLEVAWALLRRDLHGPHGVVAEATQVAVVCLKIVHCLTKGEGEQHASQ